MISLNPGWICRKGGRLVVFLLLVSVLPVVADAHAGPPFPIVSDRKVDPFVISVWTDPDVGIGTFYVIVTPPAGGKVPDDLKVELGVEPVTGRLKEVFYPGDREILQGQVQYKMLVQFDAQEMWKVHVRFKSGEGSGETFSQVEATPPGYGRWDMLLYLTPFVAVGLLWAMAIFKKHSVRKVAESGPA